MNDVIKKLSGKIIGIGLSLEMTKLIDENDKILECDLLDTYDKKAEKNKKNFFNGKSLNIKKLRKYFKKKKVDYIICNYKVIYKYLNTFVNDSIYINNKKLYFFNVEDNEFINKYKRYNSKINIKKEYIEIDNSLSKTNFFKDKFYRLIDFNKKLIELIGDLLMS